MGESLQDLLSRFLSGDESAFDPLAEAVGRKVYPRALRAVGDHETADDITQEVLLRVYQKATKLGDIKAFEGWLHRITFNLVHDHFRRRTRERQIKQEFASFREQIRAGRLSSHERGELSEVLLNALDGLDEKHREVFIMKEVEGRSHEEIAGMLNIPQGTVWSRLSYARRGLRQRLLRSQEGLGLPSER